MTESCCHKGRGIGASGRRQDRAWAQDASTNFERESAGLVYCKGARAKPMHCSKGIQARAIRPLKRVPLLDILIRIFLVILEVKWWGGNLQIEKAY